MFALALDCSTSRGSVALGTVRGSEATTVVWRAEFPAGRGCGGRLFSALAEALAALRQHGGSLAEIVVGLGPGSYSGVRQAIAAMTGLAAGTGATLSGVPSALALVTGGDRYQAVGDARRGALYYTAVASGACVAGPELLADAGGLAARVSEHPGWSLCAVESVLPGGLCPEAEVVWPSAERLLGLPAAARLAAPLEPIYLRPVSITLPRASAPRES